MTTRPIPLDYRRTAVRPGWADLPAPVRHAVEAQLGGSVTRVDSAGGGFTGGFAALVHTAHGTCFVKAASYRRTPAIAEAYHAEAAITAALPEAVPAPRLAWSTFAGNWVVLGLTAVAGHQPALPWQPAELTATLDAWAVAAEALRVPDQRLRAKRLPAFRDIARHDLSCWARVAAGRAQIAALSRPDLPVPVDRLVAIESRLPDAGMADSVTHLDLRADNVIIDRSGRAWICDWNWPCHGAPWVDTAILLVSAYASGLDADRLFEEHPTVRGTGADLDAVLAGICGFWLTRAGLPVPDTASPQLPVHQRWCGETALAWLAERQGWVGG